MSRQMSMTGVSLGSCLLPPSLRAPRGPGIAGTTLPSMRPPRAQGPCCPIEGRHRHATPGSGHSWGDQTWNLDPGQLSVAWLKSMARSPGSVPPNRCSHLGFFGRKHTEKDPESRERHAESRQCTEAAEQRPPGCTGRGRDSGDPDSGEWRVQSR